MTHICVGNLTITGSDNGLSPGWRQAIIWTIAGIMLNGLWGTNFNEILIKILIFSFKKMHLKASSAKWRPFCLGLNVLTAWCLYNRAHCTPMAEVEDGLHFSLPKTPIPQPNGCHCDYFGDNWPATKTTLIKSYQKCPESNDVLLKVLSYSKLPILHKCLCCLSSVVHSPDPSNLAPPA